MISSFLPNPRNSMLSSRIDQVQDPLRHLKHAKYPSRTGYVENS